MIDQVETLPLFDSGPAIPKPKRDRGQPPVAVGICPRCAGRRRMGILRTQSHLVWREHTHTTWGGTPTTCSASLVALCVLPDPAGETTCDCEDT